MSSELKKEDLLKLLKEGVENFNRWVACMTNVIELSECLDSNKKTMKDLDLTLANLSGLKTLKDGDNVKFNINKVEKGLQAFDVKVIEKDNE